jgi:hypothetical protein
MGLVDSLRLRLPGLPPDLATAVEGGLGPDADDRARADALAAIVCQALEDRLPFDMALVLDDLTRSTRRALAPAG